jgi:TldD protein
VKRQSIDLLSAQLVPEEPKYDYLAVDADLLGLILHEAVGHAAEGDLIQTGASGFGENGQMKELIVGPDWMDIVIDGNLENCGYLPVDAEGVQPRRKTIVRNGRLVDAIHTRQTALFARRAPDGCARMQSLQFPSLNRMTSIWVKPHKTNSLGNGAHGQPLDDLSFAEIQQALEQQGYLDGMHGVLFLSGWKGGTASCSNLEFRADVARILLLRKGQTPVLMREANFTGIATECFRSAVDAFGPVLCRSIGTCGKDGQGVLTSDGGPAFMVFSPNPKVKVIGTGDSEGANE